MSFKVAHLLQEDEVQFPVVASMALDYLAVQGSSVPCERMFSSGKHTDNYLHRRMTSELFGALQVTKSRMRDNFTA